MLSIKNVSKKYGKFVALEDVNLDLEQGVYGLLAPNGAGKTTLINMITTLLYPSTGEILWNGTDIYSLGEKFRDELGYLPQKFGFYSDYTPRRFLRYLAVLKGLDAKKQEGEIERLLSLVGLEEVIDKKMKKFSGGMLQRVGIAQAMLNDPELLILDEPTAGLDPKERVRFRNLIHELGGERIVLLSTHIVSDIESIAGKIIMIRDHTIERFQSPREICSSLDGMVYELAEEEMRAGEYILLGEKQAETGTVYRVLSENGLAGKQPVAPNLEDVFLYTYR